MIELFDTDRKDENRQSSKGNQLKFERNGIWYKTDYLGYEGLAEYVISKVLKYSTLAPSEYVDYELESISYNGQVFNGCKSHDFTEDRQLITLERLFQQYYGYGLNKTIYSISDHTKRLETLVEQVERVTGIRDFGIYMAKILTLDALFLNEDRHTHNLAVLVDAQNVYQKALIFDNGAGLLSDTTLEYPIEADPIQLMDRAKPKTFCDDFDEQLDIAEKLYGSPIRFHYTEREIADVLDKAKGQYPDTVRQRVFTILTQTRRKYAYLFDD